MKMHPSITSERISELARESLFGMSDYSICIACGADAIHAEPDAEGHECEECGEPAVYGAELLLLMEAE